MGIWGLIYLAIEVIILRFLIQINQMKSIIWCFVSVCLHAAQKYLLVATN